MTARGAWTALLAGVMAGLAASFPAGAQPAAARPTVGAIRWDAWHGPASNVGLTVEKTLAPAR
ncbi:MAG TPA: hypothetical protein PLI98_12875, partial [Candidatus Hydrogenedentes bacterium]|nr:hypothetical protein [Candidatus Hydrogenedentota bacterium]